MQKNTQLDLTKTGNRAIEENRKALTKLSYRKQHHYCHAYIHLIIFGSPLLCVWCNNTIGKYLSWIVQILNGNSWYMKFRGKSFPFYNLYNANTFSISIYYTEPPLLLLPVRFIYLGKWLLMNIWWIKMKILHNDESTHTYNHFVICYIQTSIKLQVTYLSFFLFLKLFCAIFLLLHRSMEKIMFQRLFTRKNVNVKQHERDKISVKLFILSSLDLRNIAFVVICLYKQQRHQ